MANLSLLTILVAASTSLTSAFAHARNTAHSCQLGGQEVEFYGPDKKTYDGVMTCVRKMYDGTEQNEKHTFRKGKRIEESIESRTRKFIHRFSEASENEWRHGEQLDYFPGTNRVKSRENYRNMHKIGLQESFYESGKIKERSFYEQENPNRGSSQTASIGYLENGNIQFIRCSKSRATTIDPKLCGFGAKSTVTLTDASGAIRHRFIFEDGEKVESEGDARDQSGKLKREKNGSGEKLTWTFPSGKTKRVSLINQKGDFHGEDLTYFESGKISRKTFFENSKGLRSECWWENGKPKAKIEREGELVRATLTWDTGAIETSGTYSVTPDRYGTRDSINDFMLNCQREYGLMKQGPFEAKRRDGTLEWSGHFKNGQVTGWIKRFDKTGALESEERFEEVEKKNLLRERKTYESGKLVKEEKFNSDGSIDDSKP